MGIRFGVCVNPVDPPQAFKALVRSVETGGFDYFWIADVALLAREIVSYLTLASVETTTIRIGPSVFHPFVRHPAYSANTIVTLDEISSGRCILGMGAGGGEIVGELGVAPANMTAIREWARITRMLLAGESVSRDGPDYALKHARLRFSGRKDIPIYIAGTGPKMLSLAGEIGDGVFALVGVHPACVRFAVEQARAGALRADKEPEDVDVGVYAYCAISKSRGKAIDACRRGAGVIAMRNKSYAEMAGLSKPTIETIERAAETQRSTFTREFSDAVSDDVVSRFALAGTPEDCRRTLEALVTCGIKRVDIYLQGADRQETVRLFAEEVLPHFQA
jgi:5,10-methylenetetrahydromethanopterin reductase